VELPESTAHVATDPNRVYYVGAGYNPCLLPGRNMLDGLRQGLVSGPRDVIARHRLRNFKPK